MPRPPANARHLELPPGRVLPRSLGKKSSHPSPSTAASSRGRSAPKAHGRVLPLPTRLIPSPSTAASSSPNARTAAFCRERSALRAPTRPRARRRPPANARHLELPPIRPLPRPPANARHLELPPGRVLPRSLGTQSSHPSPSTAASSRGRSAPKAHGRVLPLPTRLIPSPSTAASSSPNARTAAFCRERSALRAPTRPRARRRPPANARHLELPPIRPLPRPPANARHLGPRAPTRPRPPAKSRHPELPPVPVHGCVLPRTLGRVLPLPTRLIPSPSTAASSSPNARTAAFCRERSALRAPTRPRARRRPPANARHLELPPIRPLPRPPANARHLELPPGRVLPRSLGTQSSHPSPSTAASSRGRSAPKAHGRVLPLPTRLIPSPSTAASSSPNARTAAFCRERSALRAPQPVDTMPWTRPFR